MVQRCVFYEGVNCFFAVLFWGFAADGVRHFAAPKQPPGASAKGLRCGSKIRVSLVLFFFLSGLFNLLPRLSVVLRQCRTAQAGSSYSASTSGFVTVE